MMTTVDEVRQFWNENPLFVGESCEQTVGLGWFEEHRRTIIEDGFVGQLDDRLLPPPSNRERVLDLGCGPGFWTVELMRRCAIKSMHAADLTERAMDMTRARLACYGLRAETRIENAEKLSYPDGTFDHVNCQGVVHHTPDTAAAIAEIARVLRPGGTASLSVYYRNLVLRNWRHLAWTGAVLGRIGAGLRGRGREGIYRVNDPDEIVRLYDGAGNPVGKAYTRAQFLDLLQPNFEVEEVFFHFFPARSLPFGIPRAVHRLLDRTMPFMMYANVHKAA